MKDFYENSLLKGKDKEKTGWDRRIFESKLQRTIYPENLDLDKNKKIVENIILSWFKEPEIAGYVFNNIYPVDIYTLNNISETEYKKEMETIKETFLKCYDENTKCYYLWISFNSDGMVVSVGRTFFKRGGLDFGDLFKDYNLFGSGSQKIILNILLENNRNWEYEWEKLNKELNNYNSFAFLLPVTTKGIPKISGLETSLGNYLIKSNVQIINFYSHRYK